MFATCEVLFFPTEVAQNHNFRMQSFAIALKLNLNVELRLLSQWPIRNIYFNCKIAILLDSEHSQ